jgi:hypothetical protein
MVTSSGTTDTESMVQEIIIALLIVLIIGIFIKKTHGALVDDRVPVRAYDGRTYNVRNTMKKEETARALARLNEKVNKFIDALLVDPAEKDFLPVVMRLKRRYNPDTLSEGRIDKRYTTYTVNKGEEIVLCLRTRDTKDELYDDNLLFYVTVHELAHIASLNDQSEEHDKEFHRNFRFLLRKATEYKIFRRVTEKFNYCGMDVNGM